VILSDEYIRGFVDAEGCFTLAIKKSKSYKVGYQVFLIFTISQGEKGKWILEEISKRFKCGKIFPQRKSGKLVYGTNYKGVATYQLVVYSIHDILTKLIPFFDDHPPILKEREYRIWREIAFMMRRKEHLNPEGLEKIRKMKETLIQLFDFF
jgi:hypothetical protein